MAAIHFTDVVHPTNILVTNLPGDTHLTMEEDGQPSRWNTLRAMRALRWWDESRRPVSSGAATTAARSA